MLLAAKKIQQTQHWKTARNKRTIEFMGHIIHYYPFAASARIFFANLSVFKL
jgi:hypothetical protein